jgi:hypothetical protein
MTDFATTAHSRAVIDRAREALEAADMDVRLVDDLPTPLLVRDVYELAVAAGCSAADFLDV